MPQRLLLLLSISLLALAFTAHTGCSTASGEAICDDGEDNDGDEFIDCADQDCLDDPACTGPGSEICDDGADNDEDGAIDCNDDDCSADPGCTGPPENCVNGTDDDGDGLTDCEDAECLRDPECGSLVPCDDGRQNTSVRDSWVIDVSSNDATISVDTVDAATPFDPLILVFGSVGDTNEDNMVVGGDDNFECTFPPPDFMCPRVTLASGRFEIGVIAPEHPSNNAATCQDPAIGRYRIFVSNGEATIEPGVWDDFTPN